MLSRAVDNTSTDKPHMLIPEKLEHLYDYSEVCVCVVGVLCGV